MKHKIVYIIFVILILCVLIYGIAEYYHPQTQRLLYLIMFGVSMIVLQSLIYPLIVYKEHKNILISTISSIFFIVGICLIYLLIKFVDSFSCTWIALIVWSNVQLLIFQLIKTSEAT